MPAPHNPANQDTLAQALRRVARRLWVLHVLVAAAAGLGMTAVLMLVSRLAHGPSFASWAAAAAGAATAALVFSRASGRRTSRAAAAAIEEAHPECRNVVVTAEELSRTPDGVEPFVRTRVRAAAARALNDIRPGSVVPRSRFAAPIAGAMAAAAAVLLLAATPASVRETYEQIASALADRTAAGGTDVTVTVTPPEYTGGRPEDLHNPERLEALVGSRLAFRGASPDLRVRFGDGSAAGDGSEHTVQSSGYFVVEDGEQRRLIPLTAMPDNRPTVRIENPGKDLFMAAGDRTIRITAIASDDHALRSLELRFTRVTGSGEQFEFQEGSLPARIERHSEREWRASGSLSLSSLKLAPGDSLVYRAVSRDQRPGDAGLASSDTYVVEILGPGEAALEGVEMPPELERYGMSQQMIVLKLERLRAEESRLARQVLIEQLASLAAEQRTVRANFIFLLGGHVEDEFEEAEHSHEIQEGRLENTARRDINIATAHMTRAEQGMTAVNTGVALTSAREAVTALQRAFGRNRYLLRSLAVRSRLDPARRLTGDLSSANPWRRTAPDADDPGDRSARALLNAVLDLGHGWTDGERPPAREIDEMAERLLALDPADPALMQASRDLLELRGVGSDERAREIITSVAAHLSGLIESDTLPRSSVPSRPSPLRRAFNAGARR
jgi:hypothetical protein